MLQSLTMMPSRCYLLSTDFSECLLKKRKLHFHYPNQNQTLKLPSILLKVCTSQQLLSEFVNYRSVNMSSAQDLESVKLYQSWWFSLETPLPWHAAICLLLVTVPDSDHGCNTQIRAFQVFYLFPVRGRVGFCPSGKKKKTTKKVFLRGLFFSFREGG